jgi:hypothetical protein
MCIVPYRAVLGNTIPSVKLQLSHEFLYKQLIQNGTITHMYGTIQHSIENTLGFIIFQWS